MKYNKLYLVLKLKYVIFIYFSFRKKLTNISTILVYIMFFILKFDAIATNYFVNINTGNDLYDGLAANYSTGSNGPFKTIQKALDVSKSNDFIFIASGIYRENLIISHQVDMTGSGSGTDSSSNTIILSKNYLTGAGISIYYSGGNPVIPTKISNIRITGFEYGFIMSRDIKLYNIVSTENKYGFYNGNNIYLRDIQMTKCEISNNSIAGLQISHSCDVIALIIDSCSFIDNFGGIYAYCNNPSTSNIIDFLLKNTIFKRNKQKGIYTEKISNSIFENLIFDSCGIDTNYGYNAGIDINLKYNSYSNIKIKNTEITNCGIGGSNQAGCGLIIKARDDGTVYGSNPASLDGIYLSNLIVKNCKNGILAGEPGKNNFGPTNFSINESQIVQNQLYNLVSNIKSDVYAHNNCWLSTNGPTSSDTQKNYLGDILAYTWIKNNYDHKTWLGYQSDSLVWFDKTNGSLQNAFNVTPYAWTLYIPDKTYSGNYSISSKINLFPEKSVHLSTLHCRALSDILLLNNDLFIFDSLVMHEFAIFITSDNKEIELADTCNIIEPEEYVVQGKVRTFRNMKGQPAIDSFGGLGVVVKAFVNSSFPDNNIVVIRTTGKNASYSKKQVLRTYNIFTHKNCNWDATLSFKYDNSELINVINDDSIQIVRSYNNGSSWLISGGIADTINNFISLQNTDVIHGLWTMMDSNGLISPAGIVFNPEINHVRCYGENNGKIKLNPGGGFPPYTFYWSTSDTTDQLDSLQSGMYYINVKDTSGCSTSDSIFIMQPANINSTFIANKLKCFGDSNGIAEVVVSGGIAPYKLRWSQDDTTMIIKSLKSGKYYLTISDNNGCIHNDTLVIEENSKINPRLSISSVSCYGKNDGKAKVNVTGGLPPYLIFWSTGQNADSINFLKPGIYNVTIYDSHFCNINDTFLIDEPLKLKTDIFKQDLACYNDSSGLININITGGTKPYHISWNDLDTHCIRQHLTAGMYLFQVRDNHLCFYSDTVILNQPYPLNCLFSLKNDTNSKCIGEATSFVNGGTKPYIYGWNDPLKQTSNKASNLCAGNYLLNITDSNSCTFDTQITIVNIVNPSIFENNNIIKILPNPFNDYFIIESNSIKPARIDIFDFYGNRIQMMELHQNVINTAHLKCGKYLIRVVCNDKCYILTAIKQ